MKINVEVDLSEMYSEGEGLSMSSEIIDYVASCVKSKVLEDFMRGCDDAYYAEIRRMIAEEKDSIVTKRFISLVTEGKVKKNRNGEAVTIEEWLNEELSRTIINDTELKRRLDSLVSKTSEAITSQIKARYDMVFATQLLNKMKEVNLLNEEAARLLLNSTSK